ncbi:anti-sigma factor family protein [Actinophytocola sp.]|uniref:anti-sigma factor family protein n=1 Tax=Actinophytocola sp. TaxID=1872138 RepID=UPI002D33102B|nr:zf-HC2 domain-containing protein [Actinophytocola sp.]HYQ66667.1 zf-HC2 domain-containing protein [Actinophytocola sp.]
MTCQHTMTLGVYLLGALEPAERSAFESHLSYCEICRGELVRLAPLPGLLNQITPEDFADSLPPTGVEGMVATRALPVTEPVAIPVQTPAPEDEPAPRPVSGRARPTGGRPAGRPRKPADADRPKRHWRIAAAAAAVVVLAAAAVFSWQATHEEPGTAQAGAVWSETTGEMSVEARLVDHEWGTEIESKLHGLPPGRKCYLFVYDHYGNREVAGWWGTDHDPNQEIPASTSIARSKIDRLVYMLDDKETVVFTVLPPEAPR